MVEGREVEQIIAALNRQADATEKLIALAERDASADMAGLIEPGPPACPHCGVFNPIVDVIHRGASVGPLGEWVLYAQCHNCGDNFYGVPQGWMMFHTAEELLSAQKGDGDGQR